ncbi:MAG: DUF924 domain-containing protein [Betaproteobacteria bacterium]|nr:DUF924 domain-containing protein [Betaproteobacteria bacterium]
MSPADPRAGEVLAFWFQGSGRDRRWFQKDDAFDQQIRTRFLDAYDAAAKGALETWKADARACLALVIVLDQFPRNMFRGTARAFAADGLALEAAKAVVGCGYDLGFSPVERMFAYLPFEHAESLAEQERACELTKPLEAFPETDDAYRYALAHRAIIARFGRFPHRNAVLGRASTAEEAEFLRGPGSSF